MKKYVIKISLTFVLIAALALIWLGLKFIDEDGTAPSYRFLAGRSPVAYSERRSDEIRYNFKTYTYSFEADFNDVCSKADAELIPEGFVVKTLVVENIAYDKFPCRSYILRSRFPRGSVFIYIYNNRQYTEIPKPRKDPLYMKDGWITIEVGRGFKWPF